MESIGTVEFKDYPALLSWCESLSVEDGEAFYAQVREAAKEEKESRNHLLPQEQQAKSLYTVTSWASHPPSKTKESKWPGVRANTVKMLRQYQIFSEQYHQPIQVGRWVTGIYAYLFLGNSDKGLVVPSPEKYFEFTPAVDYSAVSPADLRASLCAPRERQSAYMVPADVESLTTRQLSEQLDDQQQALKDIKAEMDDVKRAKTGDLAEIQAQIEKMKAELQEKQQALMAELDAKKREMEAQKERLEEQIYLLDSQIYAIRCYAGEIVKFAQIRSGKNAPDTEPIVLHQKLRFLDEDLGRLASLYEISWSKIGMFEDFLRFSPLALDTFAPNERCIMLVRLSKNVKQAGLDDRNPYSNMLKDYEYYHGRTVGIIIRNGENIYLGWTEEERIHITDDFIISQVITDVSPAEEPTFTFESDRERYIKEQKEQRKKMMDGIISRAFVLNILQGVVDQSSLLPLPKGTKLNRQSEYIVYSVADKWLSDNRYGGFTKIVERVNQYVTRGDTILTVQRLVPERDIGWNGHYTSYDASWNNVRGRGDRNRTYDCKADDCTLYPINLVEYDETVMMVKIKRLIEPTPYEKSHNPNAEPYWAERVMEESCLKNMCGTYEVIETFEYREPHVFISLLKTEEWRHSSDARANFEIKDGEYINLTYLNSVWLEWVVTNKSLGGWTVGGNQVDYAYAIRYLKTALDFVRKREAGEKALIDAVDSEVCKDPDWPLKLSEWKLKNKVRAITPFQAKRFARDSQDRDV